MMKPNFFIVGAPKCGTTALHKYLSQHPDVFMAPVKEPTYFGKDLDRRSIKIYPDDEAYTSLFKDAGDEKCLGEGSTWYLYSSEAAEEIKAFQPSAKIIMMLRRPVEVMYSLHGQLFRTGDEDIEDFREALAAEPERRDNSRVPETVRIRQSLFYRDAVKFSKQVERFNRVFGKERCFTIIYDDFTGDSLAVYRKLLEFLELDASFVPHMERVNQSREMRNVWVHRATQSPGFLQERVKSLLPAGLRTSIGKAIHRMNTKRLGRTPLPEDFRDELRREFRAEVERLSDVIDRDLSNWSAG